MKRKAGIKYLEVSVREYLTFLLVWFFFLLVFLTEFLPFFVIFAGLITKNVHPIRLFISHLIVSALRTGKRHKTTL